MMHCRYICTVNVLDCSILSPLTRLKSFKLINSKEGRLGGFARHYKQQHPIAPHLIKPKLICPTSNTYHIPHPPSPIPRIAHYTLYIALHIPTWSPSSRRTFFVELVCFVESSMPNTIININIDHEAHFTPFHHPHPSPRLPHNHSIRRHHLSITPHLVSSAHFLATHRIVIPLSVLC